MEGQQEKKTGTAVQKRDNAVAYVPRSAWDELKEQATLAYRSGLLPRSVDSAEKAFTIAMMGKELGLQPMAALCGIYVVNGMVALRGALMLRLIYERVPGATITILTPPDKASTECEVEMQRPGGKPQRFRFTIEDAKKGGFLSKAIWQQHTATMIRWSAIRTGARIVFADALAGCYMEDEIPEKDRAGAVQAAVIDDPTVAIPTATTAALPPAKESPIDAQIVEAAKSGPIPTKAEVMIETRMSGPSVMDQKPAPQPTPEVDPVRTAMSRSVTEKQLNRLFAIANASGYSHDEVKKMIKDRYGKDSSKDLNWAEYDKLCTNLLEKPKKKEDAEANKLAEEFDAAEKAKQAPGQYTPGMKINQKQRVDLFKIAKKRNWPDQDLAEYIKMHYGCASTSELTVKQYVDLCVFIDEHPYE